MTDEPKRRGRPPTPDKNKVHVTMRVDRHVYEYFDGDTTAMRNALRRYVDYELA